MQSVSKSKLANRNDEQAGVKKYTPTKTTPVQNKKLMVFNQKKQ